MDEIKEYLTANQVTAADFYIDYPGFTTKEIKEALRVQAAFQQALDNPGAGEALQHPALKPLLRGGGRLSPDAVHLTVRRTSASRIGDRPAWEPCDDRGANRHPGARRHAGGAGAPTPHPVRRRRAARAHRQPARRP